MVKVGTTPSISDNVIEYSKPKDVEIAQSGTVTATPKAGYVFSEIVSDTANNKFTAYFEPPANVTLDLGEGKLNQGAFVPSG